MKAQVLFGIGNLRYVSIDAPKPKEGEALVRVTTSGICGSDIARIYKTGAHNMPIVPGHEFAGVVEECQSAPDLVGKRVCVYPLIPCKECPSCRQKNYEMCENYNYLGSRCDGGFAEYVVCPVWNLLEIPDVISDEEAAMLEPMCVATHAMKRAGLIKEKTTRSLFAGKKVDKNARIVVCGLGTIGLLLSMFVKDAGYKNVYFIGNKDIQKNKIIEMGYPKDNICDVRYGDPTAFVMDKTGGRGADVYFECIGRPESYGQAISLTAPLGRTVLVGNPAADMDLNRETYWKILRNQIYITGTWNSSYLNEEGQEDDWIYVLSRLVERRIAPTSLITHRYTLKNMPKGLDIMRRKSEEYIKIMVEMGKKI
ncbi:galactitol-1-phosphate 5-dehydrogenase [Butyrivibrio proteoclasticus]|uniref:galactitol-1-phosphate 5-dehydrogenase n=1 Tax=Butyrivibrio proteoclasticus TaxID=43305 RepID=UPI00047CB819|nr:galactitol-1-phosphate 5-dehydrogenase [Butyrivibrio proteoclasticus]